MILSTFLDKPGQPHVITRKCPDASNILRIPQVLLEDWRLIIAGIQALTYVREAIIKAVDLRVDAEAGCNNWRESMK